MKAVTALFWPEYKVPFYRLISDPVSYPDFNPDPKCYFGSGSDWIRIWPKVSDPSGSTTLNLLLLKMRSFVDANQGN